ncbi:hypothetical protein [Cohnella luojiensis]|uniref:Uncharacterized protein n=1 Tax=Cohnella luojiensis TaxID=652876 RepID=A0A4Y8LP12_9BACL|nr:hypothetical protein [Cohnella luojiensis]TFE22745.1 hypothetical protein E2980_20790 [Cohnella luojiensis]
MYRKSRRSKTMTIAAIAALAFSIQAINVSAANLSNHYATTMSTIAAANSSNSAAVVSQYEALLKKGQLPKTIAYLNAHIKGVGKAQATVMVLHLENALKKQLPAIQKSFDKSSVQQGIGKVYKVGYSFDDVISRTKDSSLKALLKETRDSGYKLETAEGFYFPVEDYAGFKPYGGYVNTDIKAYIDIMTVESDQTNVKDGGIVIGYQQLVNRAISQEGFLQKYPKSNRAAQISNLFRSYRTLTFYGANNTPLFDYESKAMQPNAIKGFNAILKWNKPDSSPYLKTLREFMDLLKDSKYKLTPEVEKFRKLNVPNAY